MKQNISKTLRRLCATALMLGAMWAAASCTAELSSEVHPGGGGVAGESEVTLRLQVPAADGGSQTRAVGDATENTVNDLYILAFKAGKDGETFDYYVTASKTATATEWTANLRVRQEQQTFVMVANAQGTPGKVNEQIAALAAGSVGHKKDDVLAKLTDALTAAEQTTGFNAAATTDHHPFTMYGQTAATVITANAGIRLDVRMHRIVARVQVSFTGDAAGTKFTPQEVSLYNYNDRARVIPDNLTETVDGTYETTPTIPAGAVRLPATVDGKQVVPTYTVDANNKIEHQIYLFETAQPVDGTAEERHVKRPCLIVKGVYENAAKPCYYRIDFVATDPKDYMNIVRNHTYNVTVHNVLAPGHDTPEEALTAQAANITATVVEWNDANIGDIDFDGEHMLGIATMKYELGRKGSNNATLLQQVKASVGLKWTANLYAVDDQGNVDTHTQPAWISFEGGGKETSSTGNNQLQDLKFTVEKNEATPERRAVMRFTARNLMVEALVVQDQSDPVYINVKIGDRIITEAEFSQLGGWCPEMSIEFGPEGTELTWKAYSSNGIDLKNAKVDGTAQGTLNGTVAANNDPDGQTITWQAEAGVLNKTFDYGSSTGVLTLIARGKKGVASKAIKLVQTKYGVTLDSNFIPCTGSQYKIRVTGNMNWSVEPVRSTSTPDPDHGWQEALDLGLLADYTAGESGFPATGEHGLYYIVTLNTLRAAKQGASSKVKLRFTDKEKGIYVDKSLDAMSGVEINGALYAIYGPVSLTPDEYNQDSFTPADVPAGFRRVNLYEAWALRDTQGYDSPIGCAETKVKRMWECKIINHTFALPFGTGENINKDFVFTTNSTDANVEICPVLMWDKLANTDSNRKELTRGPAFKFYVIRTPILYVAGDGSPTTHTDATSKYTWEDYPSVWVRPFVLRQHSSFNKNMPTADLQYGVKPYWDSNWSNPSGFPCAQWWFGFGGKSIRTTFTYPYEKNYLTWQQGYSGNAYPELGVSTARQFTVDWRTTEFPTLDTYYVRHIRDLN